MEKISLVWGRDYRVSSLIRYEYVIYSGETVVARHGFFKSPTQAKRAGLKHAEELANKAV